MASGSPEDITEMLLAWRAGDADALGLRRKGEHRAEY
jgi:hypothetical protein